MASLLVAGNRNSDPIRSFCRYSWCVFACYNHSAACLEGVAVQIYHEGGLMAEMNDYQAKDLANRHIGLDIKKH